MWKLRKIAVWLSIVGLVVAMLALWDVNIVGPRGEISFRSLAARAISPIAPELAYEIYGEKALSYAGTFLGWRIPWWKAIWSEVHGSIATALLGFGYGYPLWSLVWFVPADVRTPHNWLLYALGYGGWINVILFITLQSFLLRILWESYRKGGAVFGILLWVSAIIGALFGNFFETPFGAIPFYILVGLAAQ